jgi:hypothetical protein
LKFPGPEHLLFIPAVLLIGIVIGWIMGSRAAREQLEKRQRRLRQ